MKDFWNNNSKQDKIMIIVVILMVVVSFIGAVVYDIPSCPYILPECE